ncbi:ImmA/IrrE family metallo-endopeptidase [Kocuria sp.]|uniref:ImmA/IrrE family metallo-endopeptidase n=1 Tax=Kocuria sp. TaxID=1871328 RepID=UPI0026E0DD98|nr:ImmA/IrrE family metallo-endopeptidase [Kocuria sp.]MDO5619308.1 ImmA/IrrE family metallo-endopeptidase [Kocuria sp.]
MFDPWQVIHQSPHLSVCTTRLHGIQGATDGRCRIWLDDRLTAVERRCVLTHELVHVEMGHRGHQPECVEWLVRERTARLLVPWEALLARRGWEGSLWHLAEDIGVTEVVLRDRLQAASAGERARLAGS